MIRNQPVHGRCRFGKLVLLFAAALFTAVLAVGPADAHSSGAPKLVNEPVGPYLLSLWLAPDPLRVGVVHVTVALSEPDEDGGAGEPVLGAAVQIFLTPEDETDVSPISAPATHQNAANRLFYEADVDIVAPGNWRITVIVEGPAGRGESAFTALVLPAASTNRLVVAAAGLLIVSAVALLLFYQRRQKRGPDSVAQTTDRHRKMRKRE